MKTVLTVIVAIVFCIICAIPIALNLLLHDEIFNWKEEEKETKE